MTTFRAILTEAKVEHLQATLFSAWQGDYLGDGMLGGGYRSEALRVADRVHLLHEFQRLEVEDERLVSQQNDYHVLSNSKAHNDLRLIESDLCTRPMLVTIVYDQFVALIFKHEHYDVRAVVELY